MLEVASGSLLQLMGGTWVPDPWVALGRRDQEGSCSASVRAEVLGTLVM